MPLHPDNKSIVIHFTPSRSNIARPSSYDSGAISETLGARSQYARNTLLSLSVFLAALCLVYVPAYFDRPFTLAVNSYINKNRFIDYLFFDFDQYYTFSGVLLIALIWSCWFGTSNRDMRARVLVGTLVSFGGGIISRLLQHKLPTHPRPFYDPALGFHPSALATEPLNSWNSFPSDHAAVFGGLVAVICLARPRLGIAAVICGILTEFARTYMGAHYPSDLIGGAALGFTIVWAAQASWAIALARRVVEWECSSPSLFYMCGFFITYQIATLFSDIRDITGGFSLLVHLG